MQYEVPWGQEEQSGESALIPRRKLAELYLHAYPVKRGVRSHKLFEYTEKVDECSEAIPFSSCQCQFAATGCSWQGPSIPRQSVKQHFSIQSTNAAALLAENSARNPACVTSADNLMAASTSFLVQDNPGVNFCSWSPSTLFIIRMLISLSLSQLKVLMWWQLGCSVVVWIKELGRVHKALQVT